MEYLNKPDDIKNMTIVDLKDENNNNIYISGSGNFNSFKNDYNQSKK